MKKAYRIKPSDNVAMLLEDTAAGETVSVAGTQGGNCDLRIITVQAIPAGHKVALSDIEQNGKVFKYGAVIGAATVPVKAGEHVHVHNLGGLRGRGDRT